MPTRDEIKPQVLQVLRDVSNRDVGAGEKEEERTLRDPVPDGLGMGDPRIATLMGPFNEISARYPKGKLVTSKMVGALETVGGAIDLVWKRSNGKAAK